MENRDLLVYASIKLLKVFIVYNLVRIYKNNFGQKNYGNCINHKQDHNSDIFFLGGGDGG